MDKSETKHDCIYEEELGKDYYDLSKKKELKRDFFTLSQIWQELYFRGAILITYEQDSNNTSKVENQNPNDLKWEEKNDKLKKSLDKDKLVENLVTFTSKLVQKQSENLAPDTKAFFITLDPNATAKYSDEKERYKFIMPYANAETTSLIDHFKKQLGIYKEQEPYRFKVMYGYPRGDQNCTTNKDIIYIHPASVLSGLIQAAKFIEFPENDKYKGAKPSFPSEDVLPRDFEDYKITIRTKKILLPADKVYVRVRYRDLWFYIDDRDTGSKDVFSSYIGILTMLDTEKKAETVLTLPVR